MFTAITNDEATAFELKFDALSSPSFVQFRTLGSFTRLYHLAPLVELCYRSVGCLSLSLSLSLVQLSAHQDKKELDQSKSLIESVLFSRRYQGHEALRFN